MSRITPLPLSSLPESLAIALQRGLDSGMLSSSVPVLVWAHRPALAEAWLAVLELFYSQSLLSERLRELVRLKIASVTTCKACQLARKSDDVNDLDIACLASDSDHFTQQEQAALQFAELFAGDYMTVGDVHFEALARFFSPAQITELNMYCALMLAGGRMTYVQQAYEE
ncbi:carboxymuconolactone decarboxylase family protein [Halopseudomonas laoshanensis]|uniref:Carboxymuconolactone decarboxylase family protein n=1 Tax=Halopseudomonas laoshanensis TaxID=2268758 RepID=A0A7V7GWB5_9GAMM|nr:carboxymuconolactone decarboxylase family protein [Halopseudomonas laoshanensis]KAA0696184.1 carboxymuconolactone decarboxylase family protein [Halopseudomonas laoshanensis]